MLKEIINSLLLSSFLSFSTNINNGAFYQNTDKLECEQKVTLQNQSVAKIVCIKEIRKENEQKYKA